MSTIDLDSFKNILDSAYHAQFENNKQFIIDFYNIIHEQMTKKESGIEIEFRFGYYDKIENKFNSKISKEIYIALYSYFHNNECFKEVYTKEQDMYANNIRKTTTLNDDDQLDTSKPPRIIKKNKLINKSYVLTNSPFDVRMSLSKEIPVKKFDDKSEDIYIRKKYRHTYIYDSFNYDLTKIIYTEHGVVSEIYEFEIELNGTVGSIIKNIMKKKKLSQEMSEIYFAYNTLLKLMDICILCEENNKSDIIFNEIK